MPDDYEEVLAQARQLGEAIRRHPRYVKLREADQRVRADKAATDALTAYNQAAQEIARKERSGQPVEVDDKRRLQRLRELVAANGSLKAFMAAQADFTELMRKMNETVYSAIGGPRAPASEPRP
ncbi:MAG: YlbF family regulator [Planctomycetes bacterium]|nr:YlbF family regulator [Planctomycetota bacterium]